MKIWNYTTNFHAKIRKFFIPCKLIAKKPPSHSVFFGVFEGGFVSFLLLWPQMGIIWRNGLDEWIGLDNGNKDPQNYYSL